MFIERPDGCWEWQRNVNSFGYAQVVFRRKNWTVTRLMMCITHGAFDEQLDVCHTCDNTRCVNPLHLWLGTRKQNSQDCIEKGRHYKAVRTHCPRGHAYAEHGVRYTAGKPWRTCIVCDRAKQRIALGWPEDLAYSAPPQKRRRRPDAPTPTRRSFGKHPKRTHCRRGHPLEGENLYKKPNGGRQCKICRQAAVEAWLARGKRPMQQPNSADNRTNVSK